MEQHPVPQNVTTFQFRLIGDMTIKQFGYLAGGAILAYISYKLPVPFFLSWPLAFVFALGGVGFAFVPIEDRPMDIWVMSFIKNIYSPTQFIWSHQAQPQQPVAAPTRVTPPPLQAHPQAKDKPVSDVLQRIFTPGPTAPAGGTSIPPQTTAVSPTPATHPVVQAPHVASQGPFDWLFKLFTPAATQPHTMPAAIPTPTITGRHLDISSPPKVTVGTGPSIEPARLEQKTEELDTKAHEIAVALEEKTQNHARILELQKQLTEVLAERDRMRAEVASLRTKAAPPAPPAPPQPPATSANASHASSVASPPAAQAKSEPTVKIITPEGALSAGLPRLTTFPNVVTGITRDSDNNLLPGVLVTVRDHDGMPIRALKTNRLGQFAASTPIANGTYLVEIEDPRSRYTFDRVQVTLNGSIVPALEIIAKSQKEVAREKLAKEIFGA